MADDTKANEQGCFRCPSCTGKGVVEYGYTCLQCGGKGVVDEDGMYVDDD